MKARVFITGAREIPVSLRQERLLHCQLVSNPYDLSAALQTDDGEKIVLALLPFLEVRHLDRYLFLVKMIPGLKVFFVVDELSETMKIRLKSINEFVVLWRTEIHNLAKDILSHLEGQLIELRREPRSLHDRRPLVRPSMFPQNPEDLVLNPVFWGKFKNISTQGSCIHIHTPFFKKKDFISVTYQTREGEYVSLEAQIRWAQWDHGEKNLGLGIQFLTRP